MALAPLARADMARPGWTPGDFWSYASPPGGPNATARYDVVRTETVTVGAIAYVCYRTQLELHYAFAGVWENFTGPAWFRVSDLALVLEMANGTIDLPPTSYVITETISFDPPADLLWPLATGSTWTTAGWLNISETVNGAPPIFYNWFVRTSFSVQPEQTVTVPAGTFTTTPLNASANGYSNLTYWSPTVGNTVRLLTLDNLGREQQHLDLVAYRYQGAPVDATPPTITAVAATPPTQTAGGTVTITASVTDDTAVARVAVDVTQPDGSHVNRTMVPGGGDSYSYGQAWTQVGPHTFVVWAWDASGNVASASGSFGIFAPDTTGPTISMVQASPPVQVAGVTVVLSATITDDTAVERVYVNVTQPDGSHVTHQMARGSGDSYSSGQAWTQLGAYTFLILAYDPSGNSASASGSFTIRAPDMSPPTIVHTPPGAVFVGDALRITATVTDDVGVREVRLVFTPIGGTEQNVTMTLSDGVYAYTILGQASPGTVSYHVYAVDTSGNGKLTQAFAVTVQARAPAPSADLGPIVIVVAVVAVILVALALIFVRKRRKGATPDAPPPPGPP